MNYSYFVGIDLGKKTFDASLISREEKEVSHCRFDNTKDGITKMLSWISNNKVDFREVLFCAENMGNYCYDLALSSQMHSFSLSLACPLSIKRSIGIQRGKNDRIDSRRIATYALLHQRKLSTYVLPDQLLVELKGLLIIREQLVKQKVSFQKLLETISGFGKIANTNMQQEFLNAEVAQVKVKIKNIEKQMQELVEKDQSIHQNFKLLTSITGIALINAVVLITSTENFSKFENNRKFACYCGVAPFEHTSGISIKGKTKVSSLANRKIKVYLTRAAITAITWDPQLKTYYERKIKQGKHKASVINAVRAKIIARCFAVVKRKTPFVSLVA